MNWTIGIILILNEYIISKGKIPPISIGSDKTNHALLSRNRRASTKKVWCQQIKSVTQGKKTKSPYVEYDTKGKDHTYPVYIEKDDVKYAMIEQEILNHRAGAVRPYWFTLKTIKKPEIADRKEDVEAISSDLE